jgi:hypothetical protein
VIADLPRPGDVVAGDRRPGDVCVHLVISGAVDDQEIKRKHLNGS